MNATQPVRAATNSKPVNPFNQTEYWLPKAIHSGLWTVGILTFFFGMWMSVNAATVGGSDGTRPSAPVVLCMVIGTFALTLICIGVAETLRFTVYYFAKK